MSPPVLIGNSATEIGCLPWILGNVSDVLGSVGFLFGTDQVVGVAKYIETGSPDFKIAATALVFCSN